MKIMGTIHWLEVFKWDTDKTIDDLYKFYKSITVYPFRPDKDGEVYIGECNDDGYIKYTKKKFKLGDYLIKNDNNVIIDVCNEEEYQHKYCLHLDGIKGIINELTKDMPFESRLAIADFIKNPHK